MIDQITELLTRLRAGGLTEPEVMFRLVDRPARLEIRMRGYASTSRQKIEGLTTIGWYEVAQFKFDIMTWKLRDLEAQMVMAAKDQP